MGMSVEENFNLMVSNITSCIPKGNKNSNISWEQLAEICTILSKCAEKVKLDDNGLVPFGRYLVFQNDEFNIQLDVFSQNYVGAPHNHETWGVMCCVSGELGVSDYILSGSELQLIRKGLLKSGSAIGFKKKNDWHSTETFGGDQVASLHVYGRNFDMDKGFRYSNSTGIERYDRGKLNHLSEITNILIEG
jgi:predicted metal-dependent enzyme (double-stranded beta helix superfamily)